MFEDTSYKGKVELIKASNLIVVVKKKKKVKSLQLYFGHKKLTVNAFNPFEQESPVPSQVSFLIIPNIDFIFFKCQKSNLSS